jgi:hypothetical protein
MDKQLNSDDGGQQLKPTSGELSEGELSRVAGGVPPLTPHPPEPPHPAEPPRPDQW